MSDFNFEEYLKEMIAKGCCTSAVMMQFVCNAKTLMYINPNESSDEAYYQCHALKTLRKLIATSDKWLPILEADICEMEANSPYFAEKREFEEGWNWGYGNWIDPKDPDVAEYDSLMNTNYARKGNNRKARQNGKRNADKAKRLHKADRYHGKKLMVMKYKEDHEIKEGLSWLYRDCHCPVGDDVKYSLNSVKAKEKDYSLAFTGFGELLEDINYLEDRIHIYEEDIQDLEYEKAFGYLTERGEDFLEDYKKELEELKEHKKYKEILLRTATH